LNNIIKSLHDNNPKLKKDQEYYDEMDKANTIDLDEFRKK